MAGWNLRRAYTRMTSDIIAGTLGKLRFREFGYQVSQPSGRERSADSSYSMAVPFNYETSSGPVQPSIAIVSHRYHADLSEWFLSLLSKSELPADVYISTNTVEKREIIERVMGKWQSGKVEVRVVENRGRDIAPKVITFANVYSRYDLVLFLHSKQSSHYDFGESWRDYLSRCLIGTPDIVKSIIEIFDRCPQVGMVVPEHFEPLRKETPIHWGGNFRKARRLAWRMNIDLSPDGLLDIASGSMFWAKPKALAPLLNIHLKFQDFPIEPCSDDGTISHAIERLFLFACERAGYSWVKVKDGEVADKMTVEICSPSDIERFVQRHQFDLLGRDGRHK